MNAETFETSSKLPAPLAVITPEVLAMVEDAQRQPAMIDDIIVETPQQANACAELLRGLKSKFTNLEERRFAITRPMDEAKARIMAEFRPALDALSDAERRLKAKLLSYQREQEQRERERAAQAQREADEAARIQREAEEEAERLANEGAPVEQVIEAMAKVEAAADVASVASVSAVYAASTPVSETRIAGTSTRKTWKVKSVDLPKLIEAAATNPFLQNYLTANEQALNAFAKAAKTTAPKAIPGVEFEEVSTIAAPRR